MELFTQVFLNREIGVKAVIEERYAGNYAVVVSDTDENKVVGTHIAHSLAEALIYAAKAADVELNDAALLPAARYQAEQMRRETKYLAEIYNGIFFPVRKPNQGVK